MFGWLKSWQRRGIVRHVPVASAKIASREELLFAKLATAVGSSQRKDRIKVEIGFIDRGSAGFTHVVGQKPYRDSVFVRGMSDADGYCWKVRVNMRDRAHVRVVTLAHELAHIYCGHVGPSHGDDWPDRRSMNRIAQEIEAEMAAGIFAVMAHTVSSAPERLERLGEEARLQLNAYRFVELPRVRYATVRICREAGCAPPHPGWFSHDSTMRAEARVCIPAPPANLLARRTEPTGY